MGNPEMGDDGVGVALVEMLREESESARRVSSPRILSAERDPVAVGALLAEGDPVLLVDAIDMGQEPGECRLFAEGEWRFAECSSTSTHSLSLASILELARGLGCAGQLRVVGIQVGDVRPGRFLSPKVRQKIPHMLEMIREEVARLS
jgi:hydrogenase maturation protease